MEKVLLLLLLHLFCHLSSTTHSVTSGETTTSTAPETTFTRAKCDDYKCVPSSSASNALVRFVHQETCPGRRQHFRMNILDEDGRTCKAKNYDAVQEMESTKQLQGWAIEDDEPGRTTPPNCSQVSVHLSEVGVDGGVFL